MALETVPFPTLARPWLLELTGQVGKALLQLLLDVSGTERDDVLVHDFIWKKSRRTVTGRKPGPTLPEALGTALWEPLEQVTNT